MNKNLPQTSAPIKMRNFENLRSYFVLILCGLIVIFSSIYLYRFTQNLLRERLQERLLSLTSTAVLLFDQDELSTLVELGQNSVKTEEYIATVRTLRKIKRRNPEIRYAYIFAKTENPNYPIFIADADIVGLRPELNFTGDEVDDGDWIGSPYDASDLPAITTGEAFQKPVTDEELGYDEWGIVYSGYAPVKNSLDRDSDFILGIDVDVTDYMNLVNATLLPFIIFIVVLLVILAFLTISLVWMWGRRVELLKELDRQKDELLGIVSHQLATPVSSIKWYTEMLIDGDLGKITKEQKEHLGSMTAVASSLSDLVSMILDVSRIQLGRMKIEKQELNLQEFFMEILEIIKPKALEKKQNFKVSLPKTFPKAMLDKRYTLMTIENLLSNAVKYTPEGGSVNFKVEIKNNTIYCEVSDTGCGIPKADQEKIFGKLFRASNVRNSVDGNGFGLFVAKGAVESQGGEISFKSEEGKGTTFYVKLPLMS